jgi:hypothetical protein
VSISFFIAEESDRSTSCLVPASHRVHCLTHYASGGSTKRTFNVLGRDTHGCINQHPLRALPIEEAVTDLSQALLKCSACSAREEDISTKVVVEALELR